MTDSTTPQDGKAMPPASDGSVGEPVAWAALREDGEIAWIGFTPDGAADAACGRQIVPLYRAQPDWAFLNDEIDRLREAIRRLSEQDATLSVCEGNVTVTLDATLTDAEREAVDAAAWRFKDAINGFDDADRAAALRGLLERMK